MKTITLFTVVATRVPAQHMTRTVNANFRVTTKTHYTTIETAQISTPISAAPHFKTTRCPVAFYHTFTIEGGLGFLAQHMTRTVDANFRVTTKTPFTTSITGCFTQFIKTYIGFRAVNAINLRTIQLALD